MRGEKKPNILHQSQGTRKKPPKRNKDINGKWWVPKYLYNGSHYPVILAGSGKDLCIDGQKHSLKFHF